MDRLRGCLMINNLTSKQVLIAFIAVIVIVLLLLLPLKYQVDIDEETSIYRFNNLNYEKKTSVKIEGTLYRYLVKPDKFVGKIIISDIALTSEYELLDVTFYDGEGSLRYMLLDGGSYESESIGGITIDRKFEAVLITVSEGIGTNNKHWTSGDGMFISLPSSNRESAVAQAIETAMFSGWLKT